MQNIKHKGYSIFELLIIFAIIFGLSFGIYNFMLSFKATNEAERVQQEFERSFVTAVKNCYKRNNDLTTCTGAKIINSAISPIRNFDSICDNSISGVNVWSSTSSPTRVTINYDLSTCRDFNLLGADLANYLTSRPGISASFTNTGVITVIYSP